MLMGPDRIARLFAGSFLASPDRGVEGSFARFQTDLGPSEGELQ
jgi:hypothetical protein